MFERFTERARQVVVLAQQEARTLKHHYIGTEHILLGLLLEEEGLAARVLENFEITPERTRAQLIRIVGTGETVPEGQIPFTIRGKKVLELALREALSLGHNYIGTEHVLLGLIRENEGIAARILTDFMETEGQKESVSERIRNEIIRMLSGPGSRRRLTGDEPSPPVRHAVLTYDQCRMGVGNLRVRHRRYHELFGLLVGYDWEGDRAAVSLVGHPGVDGEFWASRQDLFIDPTVTQAPSA